MPQPFLLSRVLLRFDRDSEDLIPDLSAAAFTPDGSLWLGSDELLSIERLSPLGPCVYGQHDSFPVGEFVELFNDKDEIDIEGMDSTHHYLWLTGSHSTKRKKPKGKGVSKDLERLATIKRDANRYLLARIPVLEGEPFKSYHHPDRPNEKMRAACLQKTEEGNILIEALKEDPHLGPFLGFPLPCKENGFDIEGLAVHDCTVFLGLRGPVLRGWAIVIEIQVEEKEPGVLTLKEIGDGGLPYKKHFLDLGGLGVRELCLRGDDLLILAGDVLDLEGMTRLYRLKEALGKQGSSITAQDSDDLEMLFELPFRSQGDKAEGLALCPCLGEQTSLLVVYDSPSEERRLSPQAVYADIFQLK